MRHDVAKGRQIAAEAIFIDALSQSKQASFLQGLHTGILIAHFHPEVVGIINETMQTVPAGDRVMAPELLDYVRERADRIALTNDDRGVVERINELAPGFLLDQP